MGEPAVQLQAVGEAREAVRGVAEQALEWVRLSEKRVGEAEARTEAVRAELKERAIATLSKLGEEGRERIGAERARSARGGGTLGARRSRQGPRREGLRGAATGSRARPRSA